MEIYKLMPNYFGSNCYILINEDNDGRHAAVIDPSVRAKDILSLAYEKRSNIEMIIATHGHFDHITSIDDIRQQLDIPLYIHEKDAEMLLDGNKNAYTTFFGQDKCYKPADITLTDNDKIKLGSEEIEIVSTPGHSQGSICLLCPDFIVTGDTLFADGYGRYDLYGGSVELLKNSLLKLRSLNPKLRLYAGHGADTTLGRALDNVLYL